MIRCPGQDQRFWKPGDIFEVKCPACGRAVEFFKDEPKLKCRNCGQEVANPKIDLGCAEWCQYAEQCLGIQVGAVRERLISEMKEIFGTDRRRIEHAIAVLDYAEQIQAQEGGDPLVVKAAAILHDIGIHEAERKHGSPAGKYQEMEGPPIAKAVLERQGVPADIVEHVCRIIASHHSAKDIDTTEFRIVWDADWLVNLSSEFSDASREKLKEIIEKTFKTHKGREIATETFLRD
ncbi:MAG: HD domain-containing protein [Planctomycetota bacterium]|jgi:HD superfamily phosphodiesterase